MTGFIYRVFPLGATALLWLGRLYWPKFSPEATFYFSLLVLVFLPGFALTELIFKREHFLKPEWLALSFAMGLVAVVPISMVAFIRNMPVESLFGWYLLFLSLPASCWFLFTSKRSIPDAGLFQTAFVENTIARRTWLILWSLAAVVVSASFLLVGNIHYSADYYGTVAIVEEYLNYPQNYDMSPYLKGEYYDWAHIYMVPLLLLAVLVKVSGVEAYAAVALIQPVLGLVSVSAYFFFYHRLLGNKSLALFITLISLAVKTGLPGGYFPLSQWETTSLSAAFSSEVMLPIAFALVFTHFKYGDRSAIWGAALLGAAMFRFRNTDFALFFLALIFFGLARIIFNPRDWECRRTLIFVGLAGALLALPLAAISFSHPSLAGFSPTDRYYPNWLIPVSQTMFYFNPLDYVYHSQFPLLATVLAPWLLVFRNRRWAVFVFCTLVITPFILLLAPLATFF